MLRRPPGPAVMKGVPVAGPVAPLMAATWLGVMVAPVAPTVAKVSPDPIAVAAERPFCHVTRKNIKTLI